MFLGKVAKVGHMSEPIHGLPRRLDNDDAMAVAEKSETVRRMDVSPDRRLRPQAPICWWYQCIGSKENTAVHDTSQ